MGFKTQRFANNYPGWSKLRQDKSSLGQRLLSVFAEYSDLESIETSKIVNDHWLNQDTVPIGRIYSTPLLTDEEITRSPQAGGGFTLTYPTVVGDAVTLDRFEYIEELLYGVPTRLTLRETLAHSGLEIWDSDDPGTYGTIPRAEKLWIDVSGSVNFKNFFQDRAFKNEHYVWLKGTDEDYEEIEELVRIRDDAVYKTEHFFMELTEVRTYGFDGGTKIYCGQQVLDHVLDSWRVAVFKNFESYVKLRMSTVSHGGDTYAVLKYFGDRLKIGETYKDGGEIDFGNEELLASQVLLDANGNEYTPVDFTISPTDTRLYVVDSAGFLHVYDHAPSEFSPPPEEPTEQTYLSIEAIRQHAVLGEDLRLFLNLRNSSRRVIKAEVKRVSPSGTTEYLSSAGTWSGSASFIMGDLEADLPFQSWKAKIAISAMSELGQWDFYVTSHTKEGSFLYHTAVLCDSLEAVESIDTGVGTPTSLYFSKEGFLAVVDASNIRYFDLHVDGYFADVADQSIVTRELYSALTVNGESYDQEEVLIATGLDTMSFGRGIERFPAETMHSFRRRLIHEAKYPPGASEELFIRGTPRQVGLVDAPVFRITTKNSPVDPYIEITSCKIRAYEDYDNETLDFELDLTDPDNKFLREVKTAFDGSGFFSLEVLDSDYEFRRSLQLRTATTEALNFSERLTLGLSNKLLHGNIKSFLAADPVAFQTEVGSVAAVQEEGDFYLDRENGVVITAVPSAARVTYGYRKFPWVIYWQPMKMWALADKDSDELIRDKVVDHATGTLLIDPVSPDGTELINATLRVHPLDWGF